MRCTISPKDHPINAQMHTSRHESSAKQGPVAYISMQHQLYIDMYIYICTSTKVSQYPCHAYHAQPLISHHTSTISPTQTPTPSSHPKIPSSLAHALSTTIVHPITVKLRRTHTNSAAVTTSGEAEPDANKLDLELSYKPHGMHEMGLQTKNFE